MRPARILLVIALVLLLVLAWLGVNGGVHQWSQPLTLGQQIQTVSQLAYGILALLVVMSVWQRRFARLVRGAWLLSLTIAGGLAPVVWGESSLMLGIVAALGSAAIAFLILRILSVGERGLRT